MGFSNTTFTRLDLSPSPFTPSSGTHLRHYSLFVGYGVSYSDPFLFALEIRRLYRSQQGHNKNATAPRVAVALVKICAMQRCCAGLARFVFSESYWLCSTVWSACVCPARKIFWALLWVCWSQKCGSTRSEVGGPTGCPNAHTCAVTRWRTCSEAESCAGGLSADNAARGVTKFRILGEVQPSPCST